MTTLLAQHGAHVGFVAVGVLVFFWVAYRPDHRSDDPGPRAAIPAEELQPPAPLPPAASVRRSVARRGLLALGPLLGAVATGAILYGIDAVGGAVPGAIIWVHSGISVLALLLVVYKVADLGAAGIRRAFTRQHLPELISLALGALSVPLLVTGFGLLLVPGTQSFLAYSHLISSAWWTGLMLRHLRRYLGPALRATLRRAPAAAGQTAPSAVRRRRPAATAGRDVAAAMLRDAAILRQEAAGPRRPSDDIRR